MAQLASPNPRTRGIRRELLPWAECVMAQPTPISHLATGALRASHTGQICSTTQLASTARWHLGHFEGRGLVRSVFHGVQFNQSLEVWTTSSVATMQHFFA